MNPTTSEGGFGPFGSPDQLPPEIRQLLSSHPGWGLAPVREPAEVVAAPASSSPPFFGPLRACPSGEELELKTEIRHHYQAKLLNLNEAEQLQEFVRILQSCADGHYRLEFCTYRWDDRGLWFFMCYDVPLRVEKSSAKLILPVSPC